MKLIELFEAKVDTTWHGSKQDLKWYDAYKSQPVKVKVKNHSGIGGQPSGTYTVKSFTKVGPTKAEFTITYQGSPSTASIDLDNPQMVLDKSYLRVYPFKFYSGEMPITPRQAFNLIQVKNGKKTEE